MGNKLLNGKKLVVFYSWGGNTKEAALHIAKRTDADLLELKVKEDYPGDYDACVSQVRRDGAKYEPELSTLIPDLDEYDVIFAGSPCWWGTIANPLRTFLHQSNLSGKTIIPFMTHGTSGLNVRDISALCPHSRVLPGHGIFNRYQVSAFTNTPKNMGDFKTDIDKWLESIS